MPKKQQPSESESGLVTAAKAIGRTAGKVATMVGVTPAEATPPKARKGKLVKKDKHRVPRRQKKLQARLAQKSPA